MEDMCCFVGVSVFVVCDAVSESVLDGSSVVRCCNISLLLSCMFCV